MATLLRYPLRYVKQVKGELCITMKRNDLAPEFRVRLLHTASCKMLIALVLQEQIGWDINGNRDNTTQNNGSLHGCVGMCAVVQAVREVNCTSGR
jgi:hypothetical protein